MAKKSRVGARASKQRVFIIKPLIVDGRDLDLWQHERDELLSELRHHGCPEKLLTSFEKSELDKIINNLGTDDTATSASEACPSERIAEWLRTNLKQLGDGQGSPVRSRGKLPRSRISAAALMLLESNGLEDTALSELLRDLLKIKRPTKTRSEEFQARRAAMQLLAQTPSLTDDVGSRR